MNKYFPGFVMMMLCIIANRAFAQELPFAIGALSHIGQYTSLQCKRVNIDIGDVDVWYYHPLVFSSDATKYAADIDAATTPGSGENIVVKSLIGNTDVILNPRPDTDYTKGTVRLTGIRSGRPYLQYIHPCEWSSNDGKLLIAGRSGDEGYSASIWAIDLNTMKGSPVSRLLKDESTDRASFSPDGKMVTYVVTPVKFDKNVGGGVLDGWDDWIVIANADGTNTRRLTQGSRASWSPDSQHLLIVSANQLEVTDTTGKHRSIKNFAAQLEVKLHSHNVSARGKINNAQQRYNGLGLDAIGWLDDSHFVVTVVARTQGYRSFHDVWILDSRGQLLQVIKSASLHQVWPQKKALILLEEHPDRKGEAWLIKY